MEVYQGLSNLFAASSFQFAMTSSAERVCLPCLDGYNALDPITEFLECPPTPTHVYLCLETLTDDAINVH